MTLQELLDGVSDRPTIVVFYFALLPLAALLAGWLDDDRGHYAPWKYIYSGLIYACSIPGIFAFSLNIYQFLFTGRSLFDTDIYVQILPIASMILTLLIIRRQVDLEYIPGFDRLSGLLMLITAVLGIMWIVDRTHLIAFVRLRFEVVLLIFAGLLLLIRFGWKRILSP